MNHNQKQQLPLEFEDEAEPLLRWSKLIARFAAWAATVGGAAVAFFSASSVSSGVAITAAGASTLAAAEKIPDPKNKYLKTKHVPPHKKGAEQRKTGKNKLSFLFTKTPPKPPTKESKSLKVPVASAPKHEMFMQRRSASFDSGEGQQGGMILSVQNASGSASASRSDIRSVHALHTDDVVS